LNRVRHIEAIGFAKCELVESGRGGLPIAPQRGGVDPGTEQVVRIPEQCIGIGLRMAWGSPYREHDESQ